MSEPDLQLWHLGLRQCPLHGAESFEVSGPGLPTVQAQKLETQ